MRAHRGATKRPRPHSPATHRYVISPKFCHAAVGYLEEEAVKTYSHAIAEIDAGRLWPPSSGMRPPAVAVAYWARSEDASMRDLILAIRADEACHAKVNHVLSAIPQDAPNPFSMRRGEVGVAAGAGPGEVA